MLGWHTGSSDCTGSLRSSAGTLDGVPRSPDGDEDDGQGVSDADDVAVEEGTWSMNFDLWPPPLSRDVGVWVGNGSQ